MDKRPIGVMDSGLGGLSVIRVLREQMPQESVIFVGDQGHFPYGTKTKEQIQQLALHIGKFLLKQDVKMMIIACNTATAAALQLLQNELPIPVIGVIEPGAMAATQHHYKKIGVIGTESTIKNGAYAKTLAKLNPDDQRKYSDFVPMIVHHQYPQIHYQRSQLCCLLLRE